jgi:predicted nuclease of predicted toxin-antitoxin system
MRLLLDSCVWGGALETLRQAGHDVIWCGEWDRDPGDPEILSIAYHEKRVLVTLDKDFGELALVCGAPHAGIVRLVNFSARQQALVCLQVIALHGQELQKGTIVTAEPGRLRIRTADNPSQ